MAIFLVERADQISVVELAWHSYDRSEGLWIAKNHKVN
jgi:hypothetical protein